MKKVWVFAALAVLAMGALLAGCGQSSGSVAQEDQAAKEQFLKERGGDVTPGVLSDTLPFDRAVGGGPGGPGGPGGMGARAFMGMGADAFGTVERVDGNEITIKTPMDGSTTTVQLAKDAKVNKQVEAKPSDIKVGDNVMGAGTRNGDVIEADMLQIGGDAGAGPMGFRRGGPPGGPAGDIITDSEVPVIVQGQPGDGQGDGAIPEAVSGTVEKIEGDKITVKSDDGNTSTLQLSDDTRIFKRAEIAPSDIKEGETIAAFGEQKGDVFEATQVQVLSGAPGGMMVERKP